MIVRTYNKTDKTGKRQTFLDHSSCGSLLRDGPVDTVCGLSFRWAKGSDHLIPHFTTSLLFGPSLLNNYSETLPLPRSWAYTTNPWDSLRLRLQRSDYLGLCLFIFHFFIFFIFCLCFVYFLFYFSEGFIRNNKGIDQGKSLPDEFLGGVYDRIGRSAISLKV